ncbi:MAG: hypothetical protein ACXWC3_19025, partial [Burkholderiales bacterium]
MRTVTCTVLLAAAALLLFGTAATAFADDGAWKAAHDTDPHTPLTAQQLQMLAQKRQASREFSAGMRAPQGPSFGVMSSSGFSASGSSASMAAPDMPCCGGGGGSFPATSYFSGNQVSQITSYYCGPAALKETLGHLGLYITQDTAANYLGTTPG